MLSSWAAELAPYVCTLFTSFTALSSTLRYSLTRCLHTFPTGRLQNEMVVDIRSVRDHLPHSIEAFFYLSTSTAEEISRVRMIHTLFTQEYVAVITISA